VTPLDCDMESTSIQTQMSSTVAINKMFYKSMAARIKARRLSVIEAREHVNVQSSWITHSRHAISRSVDGHIVMDAPRRDEAPSESPDDAFFDSSLTSDESSEDEANAGDCSSPETYYLSGVVGGQMRERLALKLSAIEDMKRVYESNFGDESPDLTARVAHSTPRKPRLHRGKQSCRSRSPLRRKSNQFSCSCEPARSTI
jgi:hypothetical protein